MTPAPKLISVVMCTYNGVSFLEEQINSILQQDYPVFEIVIVDDCSTDDTWKLLEILQQKSTKIKNFRNEVNLGYNKNFAKAIQLATGDFISIADQDDIWLPGKIGRTIKAFDDEKVILAHCKSVRFENNELKYYKANLHHHFGGNDTRRLFFFNQVMGHDLIFRKELTSKMLPIPNGMSYDWWIAVMATCYGKIASVDEYLVHHRIHSTNNFFSSAATSKKKELDLDETLKFFEQVPALSEQSKSYLQSFLRLLEEHKNKKGFDRNLFRFLYKNRKIIFGHKRRLLPELSYIKNAVKYAKFNYTGKGISI